MKKDIIHSPNAPAAIGPYSQAVKVHNTVYISGQIPLLLDSSATPAQLVAGGFVAQAEQVFKNVQAIVQAAGGSMQDVVKMTIYLTDLDNFAQVNEVMLRYCQEPYPARAAVQVSALPKGAMVEADAIMVLSE